MSGPGERRQRDNTAPKQPVEYEFLPGARDILEELLPVSFKVRLFKCFLDAAVSEQIARRVAMKAATENAGDMIKSLDPPIQPRPPGADHQGDRGGHRRRRSTGINDLAAAIFAATPATFLISCSTELDMATATDGKATATTHEGRIVQVIGSTFDAEFQEGHLPEIYNAVQNRPPVQRHANSPHRRGPAAPGRQPGALRRRWARPTAWSAA